MGWDRCEGYEGQPDGVAAGHYYWPLAAGLAGLKSTQQRIHAWPFQ